MSIITSLSFLTAMHGYVFENGHFETPFPLLASMHNGIMPDGRMIVGVVFQTMTQSHAYLVSDGVTQIIDPPGSISADARDINPSGEIVGFFTNSEPHSRVLAQTRKVHDNRLPGELCSGHAGARHQSSGGDRRFLSGRRRVTRVRRDQEPGAGQLAREPMNGGHPNHPRQRSGETARQL